MEPILEVRDLTKIFSGQEQDFDALKGVSFCLYPGETLGIVGESGSGKSTLGQGVICRLTEASGGQILLEGKTCPKPGEESFGKLTGSSRWSFSLPPAPLTPVGPSALASARDFSTRAFPGPRPGNEVPSC